MNKKWTAKRLTINLASSEAEQLEQFCDKTGRPLTDVIRELIRGLPLDSSTSSATKDLSIMG